MDANKDKRLMFHGYNHPMLYMNIFANNYLCISKVSYQIEQKQSQQHIYIGKDWMGVHFSENSPLVVYEDFYAFQKGVKETYGGLKSLFAKYPEGIKIFVNHLESQPWILYFLSHHQDTFALGESDVSLILKKMNERFWIWDKVDLGLSAGLYTTFKKDLPKIPQEDKFISKKAVANWPIELAFLLYADGRVSDDFFYEKMKTIYDDILKASLSDMSRNCLEVVFNDPRVLKEYNGTDIDKTPNLVLNLQSDQFLNEVLIERKFLKDLNWFKSHKDRVVGFFKLVKKYDLRSYDQEIEIDEFEVVSTLLNLTKDKKVFSNLLRSDRFMMQDLKFFAENRHKVNTTLINYISLKVKESWRPKGLA